MPFIWLDLNMFYYRFLFISDIMLVFCLYLRYTTKLHPCTKKGSKLDEKCRKMHNLHSWHTTWHSPWMTCPTSQQSQRQGMPIFVKVEFATRGRNRHPLKICGSQRSWRMDSPVPYFSSHTNLTLVNSSPKLSRTINRC